MHASHQRIIPTQDRTCSLPANAPSGHESPRSCRPPSSLHCGKLFAARGRSLQIPTDGAAARRKALDAAPCAADPQSARQPRRGRFGKRWLVTTREGHRVPRLSDGSLASLAPRRRSHYPSSDLVGLAHDARQAASMRSRAHTDAAGGY
jgi:hypothetical protein